MTPSAADILFMLPDASGLVQLSGKMDTLGNVIKEPRRSQPDCAVLYHTLTDAPTASDACTLMHSIYWQVQQIPKDSKTAVKNEDGKTCVPSHHIAGVVPSVNKSSTIA